MAKDNKIDVNDFAKNMMKNLNAKLGKKGSKVFYSLGDSSEDPAKIKRWYSTSSMSIDGICGAEHEGMPGGRLCEIFGAESIGKSHICYQMVRETLEKGGFVCYVDTELATESSHLRDLGVDVEDPKLFYGKVDSIEGAFDAIQEFLKEVAPLGNSVPIAIFWDSIGGIGSILERDMAFDDVQRPGLNAKQITFGLRKIMPAVNNASALFVLVNQEYDILNAMKFDSKKKETKGGKGIKYNSSIRLGLQKVTDVYPEDMDKKQAYAQGIRPCGIRVRARTYKNKVSSPYREIEFDIHFGVGIKEHVTIWEWFNNAKEITIDDKIYQFKSGAWRSITICDASTGEQLDEIKFRKKETEDILMNQHREMTEKCYKKLMLKFMQRDNKEANTYDPKLDGQSDDEEDIMGDIE